MFFKYQSCFLFILSVNEIICRTVNLSTVSSIDVTDQSNVSISNNVIDATETTTTRQFSICEHFHGSENLKLRDHGITVVMKLF